jgi:hypothetical protein
MSKDTDVMEVRVDELNVENAAETIVQQWLSTNISFRSATIEFARIMIRVMDQFPETKQTEIWKKVKEDTRVQDTVVSLSRAWDATRMLRGRKDLLDWTQEELTALPEIDRSGETTHWTEVTAVKMPDGSVRTRPHVKQNGEINWEFYLRLYHYKLTEEQRIALENQAKLHGWTVRDLNERIKLVNDARDAKQSEVTLAAYRQLKGEQIKVVLGIVKGFSNEKLQTLIQMLRSLEYIEDQNLTRNSEQIMTMMRGLIQNVSNKQK